MSEIPSGHSAFVSIAGTRLHSSRDIRALVDLAQINLFFVPPEPWLLTLKQQD